MNHQLVINTSRAATVDLRDTAKTTITNLQQCLAYCMCDNTLASIIRTRMNSMVTQVHGFLCGVIRNMLLEQIPGVC